MSLTVFWTEKADEKFAIIINLLENNWGMAAATKFTNITFEKIQLIPNHPYLYKASISENIRQVVITKQTSLFYEIIENRIIILFFTDNRQEPVI